MRRNFFDILESMEFNVKEEYERLLYLFTRELRYVRRTCTAAQYINNYYFRNFKIRGTFLSIDDMMKALELNVVSNDLNDLFFLCEFLIAVFSEKIINDSDVLNDLKKEIYNNILVILEKTNHKLVNIPGDGNKTIIVENNKATTLAMEMVDDISVSFDVMEYNHHALKGNLDKKKKILTSIASYIEPILKSRVLQNSGYKQLESDAGFVFNNFHIRHNNKEGSKAQKYIVDLNDSELEKWYDNAYDIAIAVILLNNHLKVQEEIAELKNNYVWRT